MRLRKIAGTVALLAGLQLCGCAGYRPDSQTLQQQISRAVPLNSTPEQVIAYLDQAKLPHSRYVRDNSIGNSINAELEVKTAHAIIEPSYALVFHFNDQNRLTGSEVMYLGYIGL